MNPGLSLAFDRRPEDEPNAKATEMVVLKVYLNL